MRDVNYGWLLRYLHANGASIFFGVVYIHVARGLYYGSYQKPRGFVWVVGVIILILMMATAFMGYVLPWVMTRVCRASRSMVLMLLMVTMGKFHNAK